MIVSVDLTRMNKVIYVDKKNMVAHVQAGITGVALEAELVKHGVTLGHTPESMEFSTVGGWVATRSSGTKNNLYGNIEDILQNVRLITPLVSIC